MSIDDVAAAAKSAGFQGNGLIVAVAVAMAESGGNPNAHNVTPQEDSRGYWQINVRAHPTYRLMNLYDGRVNARAAYQISNGGLNWRPWTTYTSGAYKAHISAASGAVTGRVSGVQRGGTPQGNFVPGKDAGFPNLPNPLNLITAPLDFLKAALWLVDPANWRRAALMTTGVVLMVIGFLILVADFFASEVGKATGGGMPIPIPV